MLNPDFKDMLSALSRAGAEYLVVGVLFDNAWNSRINVEIDGISLPVLGREDLLANKKATGRPKDNVDAKTLEDDRENDRK